MSIVAKYGATSRATDSGGTRQHAERTDATSQTYMPQRAFSIDQLGRTAVFTAVNIQEIVEHETTALLDIVLLRLEKLASGPALLHNFIELVTLEAASLQFRLKPRLSDVRYDVFKLLTSHVCRRYEFILRRDIRLPRFLILVNDRRLDRKASHARPRIMSGGAVGCDRIVFSNHKRILLTLRDVGVVCRAWLAGWPHRD